MRNLLSLALCLPLAACVIGSNDTEGAGGGDDVGDPNPNPVDDGSISGLITSDATWSGMVRIKGATTTIEPGVTITVAAGTTIEFVGASSLAVKGTLNMQGTSASKIQIQPVAGSTFFSGINLVGAPTAGTLTMTYAVMKGGAIVTAPGSTATITDSKLYGASGDLLIMSGGTVNMSYSQIGTDGATDSTHCNIHTGGNANTINITHSNINGVPYGLMLYGGQNANLTFNNWYGNTTADVDTQPGVTGDVSNSWFEGVPPVAGAGATLTATNLAAAKLTDAGVRP